MATFEGTHISALPYVYQHFALPISPHYAIDANSPTHMHSSPSDWPKHNNWIIAWIFQSAHPVGGRWRKKTSPDFRYFANKDMALFEKECETRKQQWRTLCLDKVKAQHYADEYRAHVRNRRAARKTSGSSICSQTTYLSSICGRRSSVWTDLESICEEPSTHEVFDTVSICDELASSVIAERQPSSFIATLSGQMHNGEKNMPQSLHGALKMRSDISTRSRRKHAHEVSSIMSGASVRSGTECSNGSSISLNSRRFHWMNKGAFGGHH
ncbi:hypothetical protein C2E23DRAFT_576380 [Lenzites betulinus]|nr:hypothetical protein C2E23DRAFT_576380 [Lenzites betulinus]